jgi:hypothetical protein
MMDDDLNVDGAFFTFFHISLYLYFFKLITILHTFLGHISSRDNKVGASTTSDTGHFVLWEVDSACRSWQR